MNAEEQKLKVLKMLQEGMISQGEALDLLELIGAELASEEPAPQPAKTAPKVHSQPEPRDSIKISIPESPIDFMGMSHQTFSISADVLTEEIETLKLVGKNSKISIRVHQHPTIQIEGRYKTIRKSDPMIRFEEQRDRKRHV